MLFKDVKLDHVLWGDVLNWSCDFNDEFVIVMCEWCIPWLSLLYNNICICKVWYWLSVMNMLLIYTWCCSLSWNYTCVRIILVLNTSHPLIVDMLLTLLGCRFVGWGSIVVVCFSKDGFEAYWLVLLLLKSVVSFSDLWHMDFVFIFQTSLGFLSPVFYV